MRSYTTRKDHADPRRGSDTDLCDWNALEADAKSRSLVQAFEGVNATAGRTTAGWRRCGELADGVPSLLGAARVSGWAVGGLATGFSGRSSSPDDRCVRTRSCLVRPPSATRNAFT